MQVSSPSEDPICGARASETLPSAERKFSQSNWNESQINDIDKVCLAGWKLLNIEKMCGNALEAVAGAQHRAGGFTVDEENRRKGKEYMQPKCNEKWEEIKPCLSFVEEWTEFVDGNKALNQQPFSITFIK